MFQMKLTFKAFGVMISCRPHIICTEAINGNVSSTIHNGA